jgi:predicted nucleotide-binding protein (sugar kinase/HSP70/actin superfamily)
MVDGIILLSSFPCGPDSMVNEIILRKVQNKPILNLILDGQEGSAGMETRLESFVDIIKYRRSGSIG